MKETKEILPLLYKKIDDNPLYNEFIAEYLGKKPLMRKYVNTSGNKLFYLGFQHVFDLDNPQLIFLRNEFDRFLYESQYSKKIVFIEARLMHKPGWNYANEEEAIKRYESGLIYYLATKQDIPVMCVQPSSGDEIEFLRSNKIEEDKIILYELGRPIFNFLHEQKDEEISLEHIQKHINDTRDRKKPHFSQALQQTMGWEIFSAVYERVYGKQFTRDKEQHESFGDLQDALGENTIGILISQHTESNILSQIQKYLSRGYNIFCVYGAGHLLRQERALSSMLKCCEDM